MSARIFKVKPEYVDKILTILKSERREFMYRTEELKEGLQKLFIYIDKVEEIHPYGFKSSLYIDEIFWFTRMIREKGKIIPDRIPIVTTNPVEIVCYYRIPAKASLDHVLAVFPAGRANLFVRSISEYLASTLNISVIPFLEIRLNITKDNEDRLRRLFDNIVRVNTRDLAHDKLSSLGLGGPAITETDEWRRAFHVYEGKASSIAFRYKGYWIMVSERGVIFSLSRDIESVKEPIVYEVLEKLYTANLITIKPLKLGLTF